LEAKINDLSALITAMTLSILGKIFATLESHKTKLKEVHDKFIKLFKHTFSRKIAYSSLAKHLDEGKGYLFLYTSSLSEIIQNYILLVKQNENKPEYKQSLESFGNLVKELSYMIIATPKEFKSLQNEYVLPRLFNFVMELLEKYDFNDEYLLQPILADILENLIEAIPETIEEFKEQKYIVSDYQELVRRLMVLYLDSKQSDYKNQYLKILKKLSDKTPQNFLKEMERAYKDKNLSKLDLFKALDLFKQSSVWDNLFHSLSNLI